MRPNREDFLDTIAISVIFTILVLALISLIIGVGHEIYHMATKPKPAKSPDATPSPAFITGHIPSGISEWTDPKTGQAYLVFSTYYGLTVIPRNPATPANLE